MEWLFLCPSLMVWGAPHLIFYVSDSAVISPLKSRNITFLFRKHPDKLWDQLCKTAYFWHAKICSSYIFMCKLLIIHFSGSFLLIPDAECAPFPSNHGNYLLTNRLSWSTDHIEQSNFQLRLAKPTVLINIGSTWSILKIFKYSAHH